MDPSRRLDEITLDFHESGGRLLVLAGAGISAESGIPTFRGPDGFWNVGSEVYTPEEIATFAFFSETPETTWSWYLYRRAHCRKASPNAGHKALVEIEESLGERFLLVTQNVDGLHRRAGSSKERLYEIHGNLDYYRCMDSCTREFWPVPERFDDWSEGRQLEAAELEHLRCPSCGAMGRPHVLWFDEYYDEAWYRFDSTLSAAQRADLLLVIGTTGATNLPYQVAQNAAARGATFIDVNIADNIFRDYARKDEESLALEGSSCTWLPEIARSLARAAD